MQDFDSTLQPEHRNTTNRQRVSSLSSVKDRLRFVLALLLLRVYFKKTRIMTTRWYVLYKCERAKLDFICHFILGTVVAMRIKKKNEWVVLSPMGIFSSSPVCLFVCSLCVASCIFYPMMIAFYRTVAVFRKNKYIYSAASAFGTERRERENRTIRAVIHLLYLILCVRNSLWVSLYLRAYMFVCDEVLHVKIMALASINFTRSWCLLLFS